MDEDAQPQREPLRREPETPAAMLLDKLQRITTEPMRAQAYFCAKRAASDALAMLLKIKREAPDGGTFHAYILAKPDEKAPPGVVDLAPLMDSIDRIKPARVYTRDREGEATDILIEGAKDTGISANDTVVGVVIDKLMDQSYDDAISSMTVPLGRLMAHIYTEGILHEQVAPEQAATVFAIRETTARALKRRAAEAPEAMDWSDEPEAETDE